MSVYLEWEGDPYYGAGPVFAAIGPRGKSAAQQLFDEGVIDAPTEEAMHAYLAATGETAGALAGEAAAAPAVAAAEGFATDAQGAAVDAETAADLAEASRVASESNAAAAQVASPMYPDTATGLATTSEGGYFNVRPPVDETTYFAKLYRKVSGSAVLIDTYPNKAAFDTKANSADTDPLVESIRFVVDGDGALRAVDPFGRSPFGIETNGTGYLGALRFNLNNLGEAGSLMFPDRFGRVSFGVHTDGAIQLGRMLLRAVNDGRGDTILTDRFGRGIVLGKAAGEESGGGTGDVDYVAEIDAVALAMSARMRNGKNAHCAGLIEGINHVIVYGQSLGKGSDGWPIKLTTNELASLLMVGDSPRSADTSSSTSFRPYGGVAEFKPLVSTMTNGDDIVTEADILANPALSPDGSDGIVAALNYFKRDWNRTYGFVDDAGRKIVVTVVAQGGRTIDQLSKGADPNLYNRMVSAATTVKALAEADDLAYNHLATIFVHGESGYSGELSEEYYTEKVVQLRADIHADVTVGVYGQSDPAMFLTVQAGGSYTLDTTNLAIANASQSMSDAQPCWHLATPYYHTTDIGGHLDGNGYTQVYLKIGQAMADAITHRRRPPALRVHDVAHLGDKAWVSFDVPYPPLRWGLPYEALVATDYVQKGFRATDSLGNISLEPAIVGQATVELTLSRTPVGALRIWLGDKTIHNGNTCLRDSDPTLSPYNYTFNATIGDPAANIPALVDQPYDMSNWALPFSRISRDLEA